MMFRCRTRQEKTVFSIKSGTVTERCHLGHWVWVVGFYFFTTNIKGTSSIKLSRELVSPRAWSMQHRLHKASGSGPGPFDGPVEVDETLVGGNENNNHANRREPNASGPASWRDISQLARRIGRLTGSMPA